MLLTSAVGTLGDHTIILETCICKALKIIFRGCRPAFDQVVTARFRAEEELHGIGAVQFSLKVDEGVILEPFLLLLL